MTMSAARESAMTRGSWTPTGLGSIVFACGLVGLVSSSCKRSEDSATQAPGPLEDETVQSAQPRDGNLRTLRVDASRCDFDGNRTDQVDLNQDGRADLVAIFDADGSTLRCRQADFNFDGRLDAYFHYEQGVLVREQFDLDYDGSIEIGRHYEKGELVLDEQDLDRDGIVDAWRRYDEGRLLRIETDRDGDGRADMFTYYVAGRVDRIGYDVDGDGRVDQWDHDAARRVRLADQRRRAAQAETEQSVTTDEYVDAPEEPGDEPSPDGRGPAETGPEDRARDASKPQPAPKKPAQSPETDSSEQPATGPAPQAPGGTKTPAPQKPRPQSPTRGKSG